MVRNNHCRLASAAAHGAVAMVLAATPALAQESAGADAAAGDIVVTARKTSESILKTPIAVSALTAADIEQRGVVTLNDLSANTPGLNINNNAAGRNDRSFQQVIIRGFTPSQATNPTAALFIDGTPVSSTSAFSTLSDPERIEVLKGPQAAYFGRNTFSGAINFVNKLPSDEISGAISGTIGTRENYKIHGDISGPLVADLLSFRLSAERMSRSGSWRNQFDGDTLGDQRTDSGSALLVATPSPNLTLKAFGLLSKDKDGASAQGLISAVDVTGPGGTIIVPNQANCTLTGRSAAGAVITNPYICGTAPRLGYGPSVNTTEDAYIKNFLATPTGRLVSPKDGVQGYGLVRRYYHLHFIADWEIPDTGITISSLTAYNNERYSQLADVDNYGTTAIPNTFTGPTAPLARSYFDFPFIVERINRDFSQELRFNYDNGGAFTGTVGGSYLNAYSQNGLGGGNGPLGNGTFSVVNGGTRNRTFGAFFGATYALTPALKLSLEGRYQIDNLYAYAAPAGLTVSSSVFVPAGTYAPNSEILAKTYKNFLPRAILQYDVTPDVMAYASYSKGVNPGAFNTAFLSFSLPVQRAAEAAGLSVRVDPEKVTNYEIGLKGRLFNNRLRFALAAYFAPWRNQINALTLTSPDPVSQTVQIIRATANTGSVDMKGIELEGTWQLTEAVDFNFTGAVNDSNIKSYRNAQVSQLTGITDFRGKENPNTSKYSAAIGLQYNGALANDGKWFARADYNYKSGVWSDAANIVKTPDLHTVNARLGLDFERFTVSAWVRNLFDNKNFTSIANTSVTVSSFAFSTYFSGLIVGLPERRTFGLDAKYRF